MRKQSFAKLTALAFGASLMSGCILIPEIESRIVELAVGGSATVEFVSDGEVNNHDDTKTIDIRDYVNLQTILDDAGVNASDVKDIALAGVSYRTTQPDPNPSREVVNGQVTFQRQGGSAQPLVVNFNALVNSATSFTTATLDPLGVAEVNALLDDLLAEIQGGPAANTTFTYHVTGQSLPADIPTDFKWELKVDISIVGTVTVDVPN